MNERILELADKAVEDMPSGPWNIPDEFCKKFAELIVKECAQVADAERPSLLGCGYITKTTGMRIKEHFGVEE
jgi:hypothetical protein